MTRLEYEIRMLWAECWSDIWEILQSLDIYPPLDRWWFSWLVSQTGFLYMEYPYNPDIHSNWRIDSGQRRQ